MPLVQHLEDSAGVGGALFDRWLAPSLKTLLSDVLGSEESARALGVLLCGIHDIGKCSPAFANKASGVPGFGFLTSQLVDAGYRFPKGAPADPHGAVGQWVVAEFFKELGAAPLVRHQYACIVGGHHGRNPTSAAMGVLRTSRGVGTGLWETTRTEIWDTMTERAGATRFLTQWAETPLPATAQVILSGLVIVADWMASNSELFPYEGTDDPDRLSWAVDQLRLPTPWKPPAPPADVAMHLQARFPKLAGHSPEPVQMAAHAAAREGPAAGLMIIEAPMGNGKTEAALLCAEVLAHRFGQSGIYFGLPTMATSNPMFDRVLDWLEHVPAGGAPELNLVHSKSALNPSFLDLMRQTRFTGIYDETEPRARVQAATWFRGRKKSGMAQHMVGTMDQGLFAGLKAKHVTLRHLAIASKVVILDEVHAADDYMRVYLKQLLEWLGAYRVPVVLMSATLPPSHRRELAEAYAKGRVGRTQHLELDDSARYPRISYVTDTVHDYPVETPGPTRTVETEFCSDSVADLVESVTDLTAEGGCVGVVCNTVRRAQERYHALREVFGDEVRLAHSKFVAPHRADREADLVRLLGRDGTDRPHRLIVVGTQVLEQSLDIDFDGMITDIAPMDLLLQRIGRLHRHLRGGGEQLDRPPALRTARCYITGITDRESLPPELDNGAALIYRRLRLLKTLATLGGQPREITLPSEIPELVAAAYSDLHSPAGWESEWAEAEAAESAFASGQLFRARTFLLSPPDIIDLNNLIEGEATDPEGPRGGAAQVRDSDESLEVVVIRRDGEGTLRVLDSIGTHSNDVIPTRFGRADADLARTIASCTVALPLLFVVGKNFDATVQELERFDSSEWQDNPWLAGQLFLVLDADGRARLADKPLAYDQELGLRVLKDEPA